MVGLEESSMLLNVGSVIEKTFTCTELQVEGKVLAPEGKVLCAVVNGVLQDLKPGSYTGEITVYVLDEMKDDIAKEIRPEGPPGMMPEGMAPPEGMPPMGPPPDQHIYANYISALTMSGNGIDEEKSASAAFVGTEISDDAVKGGVLTIRGNTTNVLYDADGNRLTPPEKFDKDGKRIWQWITDYDVGVYNGITVMDGEKRISDLTIDYKGNGGDDFHMYGSAIAVTNEAKVVIDNCDIQTEGVIATAISAAAKSDVLVKDSKIITRGTDNKTWYKYNEKGMTSAAWVLAGRGTVRSTNALGATAMTFYNTYGESNGWGVYSGDEAADIKQYIVNSTAKIPSEGEEGFLPGDFGAGYAVYALSNTRSHVLGCDFDIPDYAIIIAGGRTTHYVGPSSQENLNNMLGKDNLLYAETNGYRDIPERNTIIDSDNYGFLWHSNCSGTLNILPGTELHIGDTVFLIKGGEILSNSPIINVDSAVIDQGGRPGRLKIVHLMESDDAGQTDEIALHHDYKWAICHMSPEKRQKISDTPTAVATYNFRNEKLDGDFYNSVNTAVQKLQLNFEGCSVNGTISSGDCEHVYKSYWYGMKDGKKICIDENGRAYQSLYEEPYTSRSMGGASVTRIYVHPVVGTDGSFVYDSDDRNVYEKTGYAVYYRDAQYISKVDVTVSETVNNPVAVSLSNGSVWTVAGACHLTELSVDETSTVVGKLWGDGKETTIAPGVYTGKLYLTSN